MEQPAYLERLPELMDAVERQLESASSWQALFGQTVGMRLKDLPSHKQGRVVDAINKIGGGDHPGNRPRPTAVHRV
ncbi:hypothetical protein AAVH_24805 [Aphelenchoides avenae]|nr:hypothetical protein AAVH_24805 [Aphelenchus avenae]